jgi:hypothetical protein
MVFVHDTTRAEIRIELSAPDIAVIGFTDDRDQPTAPPAGLIRSAWTEAFGSQLELLAR